MDKKPSVDDIKGSEEVRLEIVLDALSEWSNLHEKIHDHHAGLIAKFQEERREMLKYLGTIAGAAAALAPQLLDHVLQPTFFYTGIGLLCLVVVISATYVLSTVENNASDAVASLRKRTNMIYLARKPKIAFLKSEDHGLEAFVGAMSSTNSDLPIEDEKPPEDAGWYRPMDYTGEFIIFFTVIGLLFLVLGLIDLLVSWKVTILIACLIFFFINIISTFPRKVFTLLGFPVDLLKSLIRFICKK